jgi:hypothetical protein
LYSSAQPPIRVRVAQSFRYVGTHRFRLLEVAEAEIVYFAAAREGRIERSFHAQFERFLDHVDDMYRYRLPGSMQLGEHAYMFDTHVVDASEEVRNSPDSDVAHKRAWLESLGYTLPDTIAIHRFARILGDRRRHELLLLYEEAISADRYEALDAAGRESGAWREMEKSLRRHALRSFAVLEG